MAKAASAYAELSPDRAADHSQQHWTLAREQIAQVLARAPPALVRHRDLRTTQRSMHITPAAVESAIRLLDASNQHAARGDILEPEDPAIGMATGRRS